MASFIWQRLGNVDCYVEPFMGSAATYLVRPKPWDGREILNDFDSLLVNAWRAIKQKPDEVAEICCGILRAESQLHAIHSHLTRVRDTIRPKVEGDPEFCDVKLGAWWLWGLCMKLGGGWCGGDGPWHVVDGQLINLGEVADGRRDGVPTKTGITRSVPCVGNRGVLRQTEDELRQWMRVLSNRVHNALILNGDWSRAVTPAMMGNGNGVVGILMDPPYGSEANYTSTLYTSQDADISVQVRRWCAEHGSLKNMRIIYCGYYSGIAGASGGEGDILEAAGWSRKFWKAQGGYGNQGQANTEKEDGKLGNCYRECVWISPHCIRDNDFFGF